jgi:hypothetical protein
VLNLRPLSLLYESRRENQIRKFIYKVADLANADESNLKGRNPLKSEFTSGGLSFRAEYFLKLQGA